MSKSSEKPRLHQIPSEDMDSEDGGETSPTEPNYQSRVRAESLREAESTASKSQEEQLNLQHALILNQVSISWDTQQWNSTCSSSNCPVGGSLTPAWSSSMVLWFHKHSLHQVIISAWHGYRLLLLFHKMCQSLIRQTTQWGIRLCWKLVNSFINLFSREKNYFQIQSNLILRDPDCSRWSRSDQSGWIKPSEILLTLSWRELCGFQHCISVLNTDHLESHVQLHATCVAMELNVILITFRGGQTFRLLAIQKNVRRHWPRLSKYIVLYHYH